jgi:hypothetical protein
MCDVHSYCLKNKVINGLNPEIVFEVCILHNITVKAYFTANFTLPGRLLSYNIRWHFIIFSSSDEGSQCSMRCISREGG